MFPCKADQLEALHHLARDIVDKAARDIRPVQEDTPGPLSCSPDGNGSLPPRVPVFPGNFGAGTPDGMTEPFEGVYRATADGRLESANPALVNMLGFDSVERFDAPDPRAAVLARIASEKSAEVSWDVDPVSFS